MNPRFRNFIINFECGLKRSSSDARTQWTNERKQTNKNARRGRVRVPKYSMALVCWTDACVRANVIALGCCQRLPLSRFMANILAEREGERERQRRRDRQTDRQTETQRERERQTYRQRQTDGLTETENCLFARVKHIIMLFKLHPALTQTRYLNF